MAEDQLSIRFYGDPALREKTTKIDIITDDIKELASRMVAIMYKYDGIGLAAPQVGINKNLIVVNLTSEHLQNNSSISPGEALLLPQMPIAFVNPEMVSFGRETLTTEEGCLSVPGVYAPVTRPITIILKSQLLSNETINIPCGGLLARVIQHEIDHLSGILFVDKLNSVNYKKVRKKIDRLKKHVKKR